MIHLTFKELEEAAQKFDLKLVQHGVSATSGNFAAGAMAKFVFHKPGAEIVLFIDITNYPSDNRIMPPGKFDKKSFDPSLGFSEEGERVVIELVMTVNNIWQAKVIGALPTGKVTHKDFSKTLFQMIQPFMAIPQSMDALWSMFDDNPSLIEPQSSKNTKSGRANRK